MLLGYGVVKGRRLVVEEFDEDELRAWRSRFFFGVLLVVLFFFSLLVFRFLLQKRAKLQGVEG